MRYKMVWVLLWLTSILSENFLENPMRHNVDGPKLGHIPHIMKIGSTSLKFSPQSVNNSRCKIQRLEFSNLWHSQQRGFFLCYGRWWDDSPNIEWWTMLCCIWCCQCVPSFHEPLTFQCSFPRVPSSYNFIYTHHWPLKTLFCCVHASYTDWNINKTRL